MKNEIQMKKILITFTLLLFSINLFANGELVSLITSDAWSNRNKAISEIIKNIEEYKKNEQIIAEVHNLFKNETDVMKKGIPPKDYGEGYIEYKKELLVLVTKLKPENSIDALIDWSDTGMIAQSAIFNFIVVQEKDNINTFLLIKNKFDSELTFYKYKRSSFLDVCCKYLKRHKNVNSNAKTVIKDMLISQLNTDKYYHRIRAIPCAINFKNDNSILDVVKNIIKKDKYFTKKKGKMFFPVREEAKKILTLMMSN